MPPLERAKAFLLLFLLIAARKASAQHAAALPVPAAQAPWAAAAAGMGLREDADILRALGRAAARMDSGPAGLSRETLAAYAKSVLDSSRLALAAPESAPSDELASAKAALDNLLPLLPALPRDSGDALIEESEKLREACHLRSLNAALRKVREAALDWPALGEALDREAALLPPTTIRETLDLKLSEHQAALRAASESPRLGRLEKRLSRPILGWKIASLQILRRELASCPDPLEFARGHWLSPSKGDLVRDLKSYSPGLDFGRVFMRGEDLTWYMPDGKPVSGWVYHARAQDPSRDETVRLASIRPSVEEGLPLVYVLLHEGFHQGDAAYPLGRAKLSLLLGRAQGYALWLALIEGYTEARTQEALLRLAEDGARGVSKAGQSVLAWMSAAWGTRGLEEAKAYLRSNRPGPTGYRGFVSVAEALIGRPGGREALDGFVSKGDIAGLINAAGLDRLRSWAEISSIQAVLAGSLDGRTRYPASPQARLASQSGLSRWLESRLSGASALETPPSSEENARLKERVEAFLQLGKKAPEKADFDALFDPSLRQAEALRRIRSLARWSIPLPQASLIPWIAALAAVYFMKGPLAAAAALGLAYLYAQARGVLRLLVHPEKRLNELLR